MDNQKAAVLSQLWGAARGAAHHVHGLRDVGEEVGNAPILLDVVLGIRLQRMHHVRKLHSVPDEEHLGQ